MITGGLAPWPEDNPFLGPPRETLIAMGAKDMPLIRQGEVRFSRLAGWLAGGRYVG